MHTAYNTPVHYTSACVQPMSAVIMFAAKSEKLFQDAIMAVQVPMPSLGFTCLSIKNSNNFEESSGEVACNFNKN